MQSLTADYETEISFEALSGFFALVLLKNYMYAHDSNRFEHVVLALKDLTFGLFGIFELNHQLYYNLSNM